MMNMFVENVKKWSIEKGIVPYSNAEKQFIKTVEEVGEIADALARGKVNDLKDAIGDTVVCLINLATLYGLDFNECCETAWLGIKDRKANMAGGFLVKEEK